MSSTSTGDPASPTRSIPTVSEPRGAAQSDSKKPDEEVIESRETKKKPEESKESKEFKQEPGQPKPLFTPIVLNGTPIDLPTSYEDDTRRQRIFDEIQKEYEAFLKQEKENVSENENQTGGALQDRLDELKPGERAVFAAFGMDDAFVLEHAAQMPAFFQSLPSCTSDTSIMLNKQCDTTYYLLWALMYRNKTSYKDRGTALSPVAHAETAAITKVLAGLHEDNKLSQPSPGTVQPPRKETVKELVPLLFTLLSEKDIAYSQIATL